MFKKILFCSLFILIFLIPSKQDANATTWERRGTIVYADSIIAAIDRGYSIIIDSCEIFGQLTKQGTPERPDTIKSYIDINYSSFLNLVSFDNCYFMEEVSFNLDTLCERAYFLHAVFSKGACFIGTTFKSLAYFYGCTFKRSYVLFIGTSFKKEACLSEISVDKLADFRHATFRGQVDLDFKEFKNILILWYQLKGHLAYDPLANLKLIKYFEEQRQLDDADGKYLFIKDHERMEKPWYIRYPEYWFIQLTCGYGVKPGRTLIVSSLIILLFTFFYTKPNAIKEIEKEFGHRRRRRRVRMDRKGIGKRFYDALYFSVHTFIIGIVSNWHPTDEFLIKTRRIRLFKFRTLSMIEGVLGWVLLVLFVVTLTRKFIR
ncbi:MAG: hypothetical protein WCE90_08540 [Candidatus Zixiibacteriota bacterium]